LSTQENFAAAYMYHAEKSKAKWSTPVIPYPPKEKHTLSILQDIKTGEEIVKISLVLLLVVG
jgi:hypothetical protein